MLDAAPGDICLSHGPTHNTAMSCTGLCFASSSGLISRALRPSCIQSSRNKWRNSFGYQEPFYDRKLLLAACEPVKARDRRPAWEKCGKPKFEAMVKELKEFEHPRMVLLAKELRQDMHASKLVAFFHKNALTEPDFRSFKNRLQHKDLWLKHYNRRIYELAIRDTKFANLRSLLCDQQNTVIVIGKGDSDVKTLLQMEKKMPGMLLMCAFFEDRILRKDEITSLPQLGSLEDVRAQLSATLNHALASLPSHLSHPATVLSLSLDQYVKREQDKKTTTDEAQA